VPVTHLVFYFFTALIAIIVAKSSQNLDKSLGVNDPLRISVWALLLISAILYWTYVSHYTDADTIAIYWVETRFIWILEKIKTA
jgi:peptidoglycan/LPS O-acetylase OafA/YrhL